MRLIDAERIVYSWIIDKDGEEHDGITLQSIIDKMPTVDAEPTEEQVKEYCHKRCLVIVTNELFDEMKARWSAEPIRQGHWETEVRTDRLGLKHCYYACSACGRAQDDETPYCALCGAKMDE